MDKDDFLKMEYCTLREEIKETKSRIFKLAGLAIIGTPSAYFLAKALQMDLLILVLPGFICTILLFYLSESHALMRCGLYIKTKIESEMDNEGWENWLELEQSGTSRDRRFVDKLANIFFNILFIIYYIAAVFEANKIAFNTLGTNSVYLMGAYAGILIVFIAIMVYCWPTSTRTGGVNEYPYKQESSIIRMHAKK
jgi:uncharacterized membrane protein